MSSKEASAEKLAMEIHDIVNEGGISAGNLTILSPVSFQDSSASLLDESLLRDITVLEEYALRNVSFQKMSFAQIANFKGLENEAVI